MVQLSNLVKENVAIKLVDLTGKVLDTKIIYQGSTIAYFDVSTVYSGQYVIQIGEGNQQQTINVTIAD
jgi:hypothetical protein